MTKTKDEMPTVDERSFRDAVRALLNTPPQHKPGKPPKEQKRKAKKRKA